MVNVNGMVSVEYVVFVGDRISISGGTQAFTLVQVASMKTVTSKSGRTTQLCLTFITFSSLFTEGIELFKG